MAAAPLAGAVALVTGASSGIGEATALALADHGAAVALAARRMDRLEALAHGVRDAGGTAVAIEADVSDQDQARAAVARTVSELGRLDILINNAGVMLLGPAVDADFDEWQPMLDVNVDGASLLRARRAPPPALRRPGQPARGRRHGQHQLRRRPLPRRGSAVYNLTKFGVGAFSESLRQEVSGRHVRVSLVEPGATATELRSHNRPEIQEHAGGAVRRREPR